MMNSLDGKISMTAQLARVIDIPEAKQPAFFFAFITLISYRSYAISSVLSALAFRLENN